MVSTHIIYIPGLGDQYDPIRKFALRTWRRKHVTIEFVPMNWSDPRETYDVKVARIETAIRAAEHESIVLVGESAGGSIAMSETVKLSNKITACITICGKNVGADNVSSLRYKKNPAFRASMDAADMAVQQLPLKTGPRFVNFYARLDKVIHRPDTQLPGAKIRMIPAIGHLPSILAVLFIFWPAVLKEATA